MIIHSNIKIRMWFMYHFNLVPRMGPAEGLSLYHQAPNLVQIRENKIHNVVMLNNYI